MIAGFEMPDAGRIRFGGEDVTARAGEPAQHRLRVPELRAVSAPVGVRERRLRPARARLADGGDRARASREVLALVGLAGYEQQFSSQLSGGEQQRVALARAIVIRPRVLLFDEPLSNLDAKLRVQMRHEIRELQRALAITTVYVTHDQEEAMAVSDRIAVMNEGSVVQEGTARGPLPSPGVASSSRTFVGRVNLVAGRVVGDRRPTASVAALGTTIDARAERRRARGGRRRATRRAAGSDRDRRAERAAGPLQATVVVAHVPRREDRIPAALRRHDAAGRALQRRPGRTRRRRRDGDGLRFADGRGDACCRRP